MDVSNKSKLSESRAAARQAYERKIEARVDEAARLYEKQFLREMVKAMRSATSASEFAKPGMAENIYREQLDDQYVESWGDQGGLGFHKIIHDQLMGMIAPGLASAQISKGPIALTDRDILRTSPIREGKGLRVDVAQAKADGGDAGSKIATPWDGSVASIVRADGRSSVSIEHAAGLRSSLVFEGAPESGLKVGDRVTAGDRVGVLSPEARAFFVNLRAAAAAF